MKVAIPQDNTEIVAAIMTLFEKMINLETDVKECQRAIINHAEEARISNKETNDTISKLQFSVTGLQGNMVAMQSALQRLTDLSISLVAIGTFIVKTSKVLVALGGLVGVFIAIRQYLAG